MGEPGTGKTFVADYLIRWAVAKGLRVLNALPTGQLACRMRQRHPTIAVDTCAGAFLFHRQVGRGHCCLDGLRRRGHRRGLAAERRGVWAPGRDVPGREQAAAASDDGRRLAAAQRPPRPSGRASAVAVSPGGHSDRSPPLHGSRAGVKVAGPASIQANGRGTASASSTASAAGTRPGAATTSRRPRTSRACWSGRRTKPPS